MKVNANQIALVLKNKAFKQLLEEGSYGFWGNEEIYVYEKGTAFEAPIELNALLQYTEIVEALDVIEVNDNELMVQFEDNRFKTVFTPGKYAFWKGFINYTYMAIDLSKIEITEAFSLQLISTKLLPYVRSYTVEAYEKGVLIVDGKFARILEGGTYYWWKNSITIQVAKADMRQLQLEISGQEILTKDKANLRLNAFVQYRIIDIVKAMYENKDYEKQVYVVLQLALREYIGGLTLDELLDKKDSITDFVLKNTADKLVGLGIEIKGCGIRDIILPGDMKDIINQVLMAEKKAQANIIMRREETASMRSLLNTAKLMEENETLWKLKEMEYVEKIADKIGDISVSGNGQILDQLKQIFLKN
ncbi:slipin family protein [Emticicia sp. BO119]|uniref:slipin family protein n=1 Tax=Emticicia sp. BO119 TaxID=2757768 RepID=UPI001C6967E1|nr:slipin family protein [Emticicia sp. BO119]